MRWLLLFGSMLVAAGVAWYSVAAFVLMLKARAVRPAAIKIAVALSFLAVLALSWVPVVPGGVWLLAGLAPWPLCRGASRPRPDPQPDGSVRASAGAP